MTTGLSASVQDNKDSRKTAVINDELKRLNDDVLQKMPHTKARKFKPQPRLEPAL